MEDKNSFNEDSDEEVDNASHAESSLMLKVCRKSLTESKMNLEVRQEDPRLAVSSVKSFEELNLEPRILQGIYATGFKRPSKIQGTALPFLLAEPPQNLIAQSQSGTGKTVAFVVAMLARVDTKLNYPQVLCMLPTYELAIQTAEVIAQIARLRLDIKLILAVSGEFVDLGGNLTDHIIVGTPGKILDWGLKYRVIDLKKIRIFILDEADVMISEGHRDISIRIHKELSSKCQILFFSATYDKEIMSFAQFTISKANLIRLPREQESLSNVRQYYVHCRSIEEKLQAIQNVFKSSTGQAIIFCHTRKTAAWLAEKMHANGYSVAMLTGDLMVGQRLKVLDYFRSGLRKMLITTNVLARGIDVEDVTVVINFDLPIDGKGNADCDTYLHRIGRTGRFGKNGIALNIIDSEKAMNVCRTIEDHYKKPIKELKFNNFDEITKSES
uniref:RNA helicase n=1 Tax=Glossina pallidipes TaxID=7398 RepID=A0A1B0A5B2_GLOPL